MLSPFNHYSDNEEFKSFLKKLYALLTNLLFKFIYTNYLFHNNKIFFHLNINNKFQLFFTFIFVLSMAKIVFGFISRQ